jgi:hypothetical protein
MKTTLLLPNGFKKIGWAIFVPAFLLGCSICFFGENFDRWLFRETVMNNIAIIGTVVGALFIGFSPKLSKAADYAALLDKTVTGLRASGELTALLARYGLTDWERPGR